MYKLLLFVLLISAVACSKNKSEDKLPKPLKELIANNNNCNCDPYLDKYTWRGQIVYMLGYKGPACDWIPSFYDAQGERIIRQDLTAVNDFLLEAQRIKTVWKCTP